MTALYDPRAFEPLTDEEWDERRVRAALARVVADADAAFHPDALWPADDWDAWQTPLPLTGLYVGASGAIWALDALRRRGHAETRLDLAAAAGRTLEYWRRDPAFIAGEELPAQGEASLFSGESGVLVVAWQLASDAGLAEALLARVHENADSDANELMWGAPGTMLAARAMLGWTGDARWEEAWRASAEELWRRRDDDGLWTQRLWGSEFRGLGAAHGVVGNVVALLQGRDLLDAARREALERETAAALARFAVVSDGLANWPVNADEPLADDDGEIRLQWCYGGAGVVASASSYLDRDLLAAGGELVWRAGAPGLEKGPSICHGTAGNGYALLKLFERTGDERWLERARRLAVHALGQVERLRHQRGRGRYSLWTGDLGVALYAADCLDARTAYPIVDSWDW